MPKLTKEELDRLIKFSNKIYDFLYCELNLSEEAADAICDKVFSLIQKEAENK